MTIEYIRTHILCALIVAGEIKPHHPANLAREMVDSLFPLTQCDLVQELRQENPDQTCDGESARLE